MAAIRGAPRDDFDDERVARMRARLDGAVSYQAVLDTMYRLGILFYNDQHWNKPQMDAGGHAVALPQVDASGRIATTMNFIRSMVLQWSGRLGVSDWTAEYRPTEMENPKHIAAARLCNRWWGHWEPFSGMGNVYEDTSFYRVLLGSGIMAWNPNPKAPGGIAVENLWPSRVVTDPMNRNPLIDRHDWTVEIALLTVEQAKAYVKTLGALETKRELNLDSAQSFSSLMGAEYFYGRELYNLMPGASAATTGAILAYTMYEENFGRQVVVFYNPATRESVERNQATKGMEPVQGAWFILSDEKYKYGCRYLKLDCYRNPVLSHGIGVAVPLIPMQILTNIAIVTKARREVRSARYKWAAIKGSITNPDELTSSREGGIVWLSKRVQRDADWPQLVTLAKGDPADDSMIDMCTNFAYSMASVTPTMQGETVKRGQAAQAYALLLQQGTVPIADVAREDFRRANTWSANLVRAGIAMYGRQWGRSHGGAYRNILRKMLGRGVDKSTTLVPDVVEVLLDRPCVCVLREEAFRPETTEEVGVRISNWITGGRMTPAEGEFLLFQKTGIELRPGLKEAYINAHEFVRQLFSGEASPEDILPLADDYTILMQVIQGYLRQHRTAGFSASEVGKLLRAYALAERYRFGESQMAGAEQEALGPSAGAGEPVSAAPVGAGEPVSAASSAPMVVA